MFVVRFNFIDSYFDYLPTISTNSCRRLCTIILLSRKLESRDVRFHSIMPLPREIYYEEESLLISSPLTRLFPLITSPFLFSRCSSYTSENVVSIKLGSLLCLSFFRSRPCVGGTRWFLVESFSLEPRLRSHNVDNDFQRLIPVAA